MTDASMNEEAAIPREAAWPQEVVELVKAARKFRQAFVIATGGKSPFCKVALDILDAALTPFKEIAND